MNYIKIRPSQKKLKDLYLKKEKTLKEIGVIFKCSDGTIRKRLIEIGVKLRKAAHLGQTEKSKQKLSKIKKGTKLSLETKKKILKSLVGRFGPQARNWRGGKIKNKGYVLVRNRSHPRAKNNYIGEHILIIEKKMGRYLEKGEIVHHKNRNRSDNRIKNLSLFKNQSEHIRHHNLNKNVFK